MKIKIDLGAPNELERFLFIDEFKLLLFEEEIFEVGAAGANAAADDEDDCDCDKSFSGFEYPLSIWNIQMNTELET